MKRVAVFVGTQKDKDGTSLSPFARARGLEALRKDAARTFGGYTITKAMGGWVNDAGALVEEEAVRLDLYTDKPEPVAYAFARRSADLFNQSSVLLDYDGFGRFVTGATEYHDADDAIAAIA